MDCLQLRKNLKAHSPWIIEITSHDLSRFINWFSTTSSVLYFRDLFQLLIPDVLYPTFDLIRILSVFRMKRLRAKRYQNKDAIFFLFYQKPAFWYAHRLTYSTFKMVESKTRNIGLIHGTWLCQILSCRIEMAVTEGSENMKRTNRTSLPWEYWR